VSASALIVELERDRAFGVDPSESSLWSAAPAELRRSYAGGLVSVEDFWVALERWLRATSSPLDSSELWFERERFAERQEPDAQAASQTPAQETGRGPAGRLLDLAARATGRKPEARRGE
jgi:hypothetical protein